MSIFKIFGQHFDNYDSNELERAQIQANAKMDLATKDVEKRKVILEHQKEMQKAKLEMGSRDLEMRLQHETQLEWMKADLEKDSINKKSEIAKLQHEQEVMKAVIDHKTLPMKLAHTERIQKMEHEVIMKMIDKGYGPFELVYALAGVSRTLRNDKSDNDRKYLREIARHKLALQMQNLQIESGATSTSSLCPSAATQILSDSDSDENETEGEVVPTSTPSN